MKCTDPDSSLPLDSNPNLDGLAIRISCAGGSVGVWRGLAIALLMLILFCNGAIAQSTRKIGAPETPPRPAQATATQDSRAVTGSSSQPGQWLSSRRTATAVGANAKGEVWIIADDARSGAHIFRLLNNEWREVVGAAVRIAVGPGGNAWVVQADGKIFHYTGTGWQRAPGDAMDIGVGADGAVWMIGRDQSISRARGALEAAQPAEFSWEKVFFPGGAAVRIAVGPEGNPWVVSAGGQVYHYTGMSWVQFPVSARDVAVGPDGVVYLVGTKAGATGFPILRSEGTNWVNDGMEGESIAAGPAGVAYVIKAGAGGTLAERRPNRLTAGAPPVLPKPAAQPVQPASANSPSGQSPSPNGVRQIAGTQPAPTQPSSTSTQSANQTSSGAVPIPLNLATVQVPQPSSPTAVSVPALSQPAPVATLNVTPTAPSASGASSGGPHVAGGRGGAQSSASSSGTATTPPTSTAVAPPGTASLQGSTITLNQPGAIPLSAVTPPGAPAGSGNGSTVTGGSLAASGSLVTSGSSAGNPVTTSNPSGAPLQVTGLGYVPISAPAGSAVLIPGDPYVYTQGKLLCSDPEVTGACGNVDAGYVGGYTLNTTCQNGFYDMTDGGTCWNCPASDSQGSWVRSGDPVTSATACTRDAYSSAHWDSYGLAWNCSPGQFWDSQDQNHNVNGSCWDCPMPYAFRSQYPVWSSTACYQPQTSPAALVNYNGCPTPNAKTMYPNDMRRPGEAFLDIASGISVANDAGGACWACPVTDEKGNYLLTERNVNTLIGLKTGNNGCSVDFKYTMGVFVEPGLSGLPGVADVLTQEQVFQNPAALTSYLYGIAGQKNFSGATADNWVAAQWKDIAAHPYQNAQIKALMYEYVTGGAPTFMYASGVPGTGTTAEQAAQTKLVNSFQEYIRARRTYVAQVALDMYYAWKQNLGVQRSLHAESELQIEFYYGSVPLDFQSIAEQALAPTVTGTAVLSSIVSGDAFASIEDTSDYAKVFTKGPGPNGKLTSRVLTRNFRVNDVLRSMFESSEGSGADAADAAAAGEVGGETAGESGGEAAAEGSQLLLAQLDLASGPVGIVLAGATLAAMAIQQVVQIATAESDLINAKNTAMGQVNLSILLQQTNGPNQAAEYWSDATGNMTEPGDPGINAQAAQAYTTALQSHFAQLPPPSANAVSNTSTPNAPAAPNKTITPRKAPGLKN